MRRGRLGRRTLYFVGGLAVTSVVTLLEGEG
jgi:hypothetical protein